VRTLGDTNRTKLANSIRQYFDINDPMYEILVNSAQLVQLERGRFVFHSGEKCAAFLILLEGEVRVQLTSASGREVTLYRISPGGSCILTTSCLLSHETYPAEAIASSAVVAAAIPDYVFQNALDRSRTFRAFVFEGFSQRLKNVIAKIEELAFTSIDVRLARTLLDLNSKGITSITHQQIAVELGTAREVVTRHLRRFESLRWVRLTRGQVAVIDEHSLRELVSGSLGD
jgi:CRP/FNR family transcriptional regulator